MLRSTLGCVALAAVLAIAVAQGDDIDSIEVGAGGEYFHHDVDATTVAVGGGFVCALEASDDEIGGPVRCWGRNNFDAHQPPRDHMIQVCAADLYACGVTSEGAIKCWGHADWGIDRPGSYLQVSCGKNHLCAITKQNTVRCWGHNEFGQLDAPGGEFVQVSCGRDFSCALSDGDGKVACWGSGRKGATKAPQGSFVQVSASGTRHACGVQVEGDVRCWGYDAYGVTLPPEYDGVPYLQVTSGRSFSCGIKESGKLICWGDTQFYEKAGGDTQEYVEISSWDSTFCGISVDAPHGVHCWGRDGLESRPDLHTAI